LSFAIDNYSPLQKEFQKIEYLTPMTIVTKGLCNLTAHYKLLFCDPQDTKLDVHSSILLLNGNDICKAGPG
jgi:hypothetical protein